MTTRFLIWFTFFFSLLIISYWVLDYSENKKQLTGILVEKSVSIHRLIGPELEFSQKIRDEFMDERRTRIEGSADIIGQISQNGKLTISALKRIAEINNFSHIFIWDKNKKLIHYHQSPDYEFPDSLNATILSQANDLLEKNNPGFVELFNVVDSNLVFLGYTGAFSGQERILILSDARYRATLLKKLGFQRLVENFSNDPSVLFIRVNEGTQPVAGLGIEGSHDEKTSTQVSAPVGFSIFLVQDSTGHWFVKCKSDLKTGGNSLSIITGVNADELGNLHDQVIWKGIYSLLGTWLVILLLTLVIESRRKYQTTVSEKEFIRHQSESMIEGLPEGLLVLSDSGKVLVLNRKIELWFSVRRQDYFGKDPETLPDHIRKLIWTMENDNLNSFQIKSFPGFERDLVVSRTFYPGKPAFYVYIFTDVTEYQKLQREMEDRKRLSELGTLSAGLAHEIRNPINTLGLILQRIQSENEDLDPDVKPMLTAGLSEIKRINHLVEEILSFARSRSEIKSLIPANDLSARLRFRLNEQLQETGVGLETDLPDSNMNILADPVKLLQILENLLLNAISVSEPGRLVKIRFRDGVKYQKIYISDSGPGIPNENREQIFYPFFTTRAGGTGLGLYLVRQYASHMGISISLASVPGKGTIFSVTLLKPETTNENSVG